MGKWVESENCVKDLPSAKKLLFIYKDNSYVHEALTLRTSCAFESCHKASGCPNWKGFVLNIGDVNKISILHDCPGVGAEFYINNKS